MSKKLLWIYTDGTEYSLPMIVCDTSEELAQKLGVTSIAIRQRAYYQKINKSPELRVEVVEI